MFSLPNPESGSVAIPDSMFSLPNPESGSVGTGGVPLPVRGGDLRARELAVAHDLVRCGAPAATMCSAPGASPRTTLH